MMMRRRTTDEKAWLAGQSKANRSKQHRGQTAQWGIHTERVHTRLVRAQGGKENSKTGEHRFFSSPSSLLEGGNVKMLFSRGANKNKAPFGVNKPSHIWKVKYQGYHSRVVPLDLDLGVVSSGHRQATNAQGRRSPTVKHGEAR
jgi:hypothetical protein